MSKHIFIDTVISIKNILYDTDFHETTIPTEVSTKGGGGRDEYH